MLEPLPCWKDLDPKTRREWIASLVQEIEEETAAARRRAGVQPAGAAAVLLHDPQTRPEKLKKGPAPLFHTATAEMRQLLREAYAEFVGKFRDAAEKLRAGRPQRRLSVWPLPSRLAVRAWVNLAQVQRRFVRR